MKAIMKIWFVFVVCFAWHTQAASGTWDVQAGGRWSEAANWLDGIVANGTSASASFFHAPGDSVDRPVIWIDQDVTLNTVQHWHGGKSEFTYAPARIPGSLDYYVVDMGTDGFVLHGSRIVSFKTRLIGSGTVIMRNFGTLVFRNKQTFTSLLELQDSSGSKGLGYEAYAASTNVLTGDLLATESVALNDATFKLFGRYPRPATNTGAWELRAGTAEIMLTDEEGDTETFLSPGQVVTGEHIQDGTYVELMPDRKTVYLNQALKDDFTGIITQALSFAAAPRWDAVQRIDSLQMFKGSSGSSCGVEFKPLIADGYGTNSVTLHVGMLSGDYPLRVSMDTSGGGQDGRLKVDCAEMFGGTVRLADKAALHLNDQRAIPATPASDAAFWVDANNASSLTKDGADGVTVWADARGAGYPSAVTWLEAPVYTPDALNGLPVVDFGAQGSSQCLQWDREIAGIQAVFWVIGSQAGGGSLLGRKPGGSTSNFTRGFDALKGGAAYVDRDNGLIGINEAAGEYLWINGQMATMPGAGLSGEFDLVSASIGGVRNYKASAFGRIDNTAARYQGGQQLAEVIVYTNALTAQQIRDTEAYLSKKWFNRELVGYGAGKGNIVAVESGANALLAQSGNSPIEIKYLEPAGSMTIAAGSTVKMKANASLPKLTLEEGAKVILQARKIPSAPAMEGNILWLDASRAEDFTFGSGTEVDAWHNRGGGSVAEVTPGTIKPTRVQDAQGRWLVDLGDRDNGCCLMALTNLMTRSVFTVWLTSANGTQPWGSLARGYLEHGEFRADMQRVATSTALLSNASRTALNGAWYKDGLPISVSVTEIPLNQLMLVSGVMQGWAGRVSAIGGQNFTPTNSASYALSGGMQLGEVLIYDRTLTDDERRDVEAYLTKKWFDKVLPGYAGEGGACLMRELTVNGAAEIEVQGNSPVRVTLVSGSGVLTTSGEVPLIVGESSVPIAWQTGFGNVSVAPVAGLVDKPADSPLLHFDASDAASVDVSESGGVTYATKWRDQISSTEAVAALNGYNPMYKAQAANGLPVIDFGSRGSQRGFQWAPMSQTIRTVFWMFKNEELTGGGFLLGTSNTVYNASHFARGGNNGTLLGHSPLFHDSRSSPAVRNGTIYIDGEKKVYTDVPKWDYQVISVVTTGDTDANQIAADRVHGGNCGGMELGELIIYDRALSAGDCAATEDYLMTKWLDRRSPRAVYTNTLGVVDTSTLAAVRVTEIDGQPGNIGSFRGDGEAVLDGANVTVWSDAETFSGRVVLRNNSTVTLKSDFFAAAEWIVEEGSVLNLGGQTVTVAGIGGNGSVSNGTLIVNHLTPGMIDATGTLTVHGDLTLVDGAVVTVHYDRPQHGALRVNGLLTIMGGGTVFLEAPKGLNAGFTVPLINYGSIAGAERLSTDWLFDGDYSKATFIFRMDHLVEDQLIMYRGFAKGTCLLIR